MALTCCCSDKRSSSVLIFSSRYFVRRAFSLACRTVSWERKEERKEERRKRRGSGREGVEREGIRWGKRGRRGGDCGKAKREEEEERSL